MKIEKRQEEADLRLQRKTSTALKNLHSQELRKFKEEAFRLSNLVDHLYPIAPTGNSSDDLSYKSLEWDNSEESSPSFVTNRTSFLSDRSHSVVDDIIDNILGLDNPAECQEEFSPEALDSGTSVRRNTSTDNQFLDPPPASSVVPQIDNYQWPPRFPSQEPEVFDPFDSSSLNQDLVPVEVFEVDIQEAISTMEEEEFKLRVRAVKLARGKVKNAKKNFTANNVSSLDVVSYGVRLKEIRDKLDAFEDLFTELVVDLDAGNVADQARITELETWQADLCQEVLANEAGVKQKVEQIILTQPITMAEQESLDLKKKEIQMKEEEKRISKVEKKTKVEVDIEDVSARATTLTKLLHEIYDAELLTDLQVRENLAESKKWENKLEDLFVSKVKIDKDVVGLDICDDHKDRLTDVVNKAKLAFDSKVANLKKVDSKRSLFSLSKVVKEVAVYPKPFEGKKGEDVYKFKEKFAEAVIANQVGEKHKVDVLRKHLRGLALSFLGEHYVSFDEAIKALVERYGQPQNTWDAKMAQFLARCDKPGAWKRLGSQDRETVIAHTCEFLREAEKLAKDHPCLESSIYDVHTVRMLVKVLPPEITEEIVENGDAKTSKEEILEIKNFMEKKQRAASRLSQYSAELSQAQANFGSVHSFDSDKRSKYRESTDDHDCTKSSSCNSEWGSLGCVLLYQLATIEERREMLSQRNGCYICGKRRKKETHTQDLKTKRWSCKPKTFASSSPARCKDQQCKLGAAVCFKHSPNAKQELLDWINKNKIKTTVTTLMSLPVCPNMQNSTALLPPQTKFTKNERIKLQSGDLNVPFSNQQLQDFFVSDLKTKGFKASRKTVNPVPEGEIAFVFCKIKGKQAGIQAFIDSGANCCIMSDGVPQRELNSVKLQDGPINIDVATGIVVQASGEWGSALPLNDGTHQLLRGLTVPRVTSDMPTMRLGPWFEKIKANELDNDLLQNVSIPKELGGYVDMILGISFSLVHPEPIHTFPDGLTIYKSKFLPVNPGELACIGGPMASINNMVHNAGARSSIRRLCNLISGVSAGFSPRLEFFPSSVPEMERTFDYYVDKEIPCLAEFLDVENKISSDEEVDKSTEEDIKHNGEEDEEDEEQDASLVDDDCVQPGVACDDCGAVVLYENQLMSVQTEMKRFLQQQEVGLDCTFRCLRCRDCKLCLKGAGEERKSMQQEAHQEIIRQSVYIDKQLGRAVAKLPFLTDPAGKLTNNTRLATKRLENVCRKYGKDEHVKEMINQSFKKLFDRGHFVYLKDLPEDVRLKIINAMTSYTIPYDVAFKEGSISTPARPVFDASAKTPGGESLNNLLAKGIAEMVRLLDMMLDWRMGPSALTGDIRQFFNNVLLHPDHWQYQKILIKKDLDPEAEVVTAIIKTLIYGVKPVGNQCDEVIKLLADDVWEEFPEVATMLVLKRYVDDFGQSTLSKEATENLIGKTNEVLAKIKMEVKGWVIAGKAPPPDVSEDGVSVGFAGLTWFPLVDFFKLNIQSLHFAKKKRGKFPSDLVKFDQTSGISIEQYTPKQITRTNCTSVTARIFDITGLVAPVTLKMKYQLRKLIGYEPSWTKPIPDHQRAIWVNLFKTVEDIRDILYLRCSIPVDALSCKARFLLLCDAADVGIIMAAYVCYERPGQVWSCDLLFGKGLLAHENWTIPNKELHGLSALSNLKVILENSLSNWIESFHAFSDSEIALCWAIYEKVKLTTFVRNRVINIRTKMGLELLHHVDGKHNPCDVGTRPELITADSVRPGSIWLSGCEWMKGSLHQANDAGIIKSVNDIRLTNEKKKTFKEGIAYDSFDEVDQGFFGIKHIEKIDVKKIEDRLLISNYIYDPLKRAFTALVRITAIVMLAKVKLMKGLIRRKIRNGTATQTDFDRLKRQRFPEPKFSVFSLKTEQTVNDPEETKDPMKRNLCKYFSVNGFPVSTNDEQNPVKIFRLEEKHLSAALDNLYRKATKEVKEFNHKKDIEKIAMEKDGILYSTSRLLEEAELKVVGHLADTINIEQFTGVNFRVPLVDQHSPLAISIALHLHYHKFPHKGAETQYRMSLQFAKIISGRKLFNRISSDCVFCKKMQKKVLEQMMGPLSESQISVSPVFFYTLVDLWGPLRSFVPGYEKVTRSTLDKPHEIYILVFACCATGTVNCQVIEGKDAGYIMDGMNRFFMETTVPKLIYSDEEGGLVRALKHGRVDLVNLTGTLSRQRGIRFETVVPQGHSGHGRIEKRIHMLQQSLEKSEIRSSRCTSMGWHTLAKAVERTVNSVPIGFLHHNSGGINPLLRILTPNCLRLISTSDRAPASLFNIPDSAESIMENIQQKYETWYHVWNEQYIPLIMDRQKWHFKKENLCPGDIVYFKLKESKMSATWKIGKVEEVSIGNDGYVRRAVIAYKDTTGDDASDWTHRTVDRPVRNIVKLFHIDDTTLMDEIQAVYKHAKKLQEQDELTFDTKFKQTGSTFPNNSDKLEEEIVVNEEVGSFDETKEKFKENDDYADDSHDEIDELTDQSKEFRKKTPKKRKTELEKLKIEMEGWNMSKNFDDLKTPDLDSLQAVMINASPFIHNFMSATTAQSDLANEDLGNGTKRCSSIKLGVSEGYEAENDDDIFNVISNISFDDNLNDIYMI